MESSIPSGKPEPRGCRVDPCRLRQRASHLCQVASRIQQDIRQRVPHLARRPQHVKMKTIGEHRPAALEDPIHGSRNARGNRFHAAGQVALARSLRNQVHVVVLDRVVREPEAPAVARRSEAALELTHERNAAQRRQPAPDLQRDVARKTGGERRTSTPRMTRIQTGLAPGTRASSSPARASTQIELELPNSPGHEQHCDMRL